MRKIVIVSLLAVLATAMSAQAAISAGNLVIYRVGDGTAALGTAATAVYLDEYNRVTGALVSSIPLSTLGASALTAVGNATTEGIISRSQDGTKLVFTGYRKNAGGTIPSSDTAAVTNRVIGTVGLTGVPDTTSVGINSGPAGSIRSATTVSGSTYYLTSASSNFVSYVATPGNPCSSTAIDARNSRQVNLFNNELIVSNGSTSITGKVQSYGILPTGVTAATPLVVKALADAVHGFVVLDLDGNSAMDTIYLLSTVESKLQKWNLISGTWVLAGQISTAASNITYTMTGSNVNLYLTSGTTLSMTVDTSGLGGTLSNGLRTLATAGTFTAFRGIGVIPEPATLALLAFGGLALLRRR
jgi:hypothetical protein